MKLLLAEDEQSLSKALTAILEHNGYTVDAVYDGIEALEYLKMGEYDGVIMDIMMPRMDGMTALRKIREQRNLVPILMLTAKSEVYDKVAGLDNGANDYLTKPFASKELLARIRAMTRTQTMAVTSKLQFGNISLDQATKGMIGCGLGILFSWITILIISNVRDADVTYQMSMNVVWIAVAFSIFIGLVFGIYPANKAARKKPVDALRYTGEFYCCAFACHNN